MKRILIIGLSLGALTSLAADSRVKEILAHVPRAELPARAADLITQAEPRDREVITREVVKNAVTLSPATAPIITSAIAQAVPEMAAIAAGVAAVEQPKQAAAIARAAAAAVPSKAGKIVVAVCRAVPIEYRSIAVTVAQAVPASGVEILNAVAMALPDLKAGIERVLASYRGNTPSVAKALDPIAVSQDSTLSSSAGLISAPLVRAPIFGPPFIPLSGTPTNVQPTTSGNVPPGARGGPTDYAQP